MGGGAVMRSDTRLLVDWYDPDVDAEAWLAFESHTAGPDRLRMYGLDDLAEHAGLFDMIRDAAKNGAVGIRFFMLPPSERQRVVAFLKTLAAP